MNKGWLKCSLGKVISIKHGYSFKGEYFSQKGKYIILTPGNFHEEGGFRNTPGKEKYYIGQFPVEYICSKNDLIVVMTEQAEGLLGSTALVPAGDTFLHNQRIGLISIDKGVIDRDFVNYLFRTKNVRNQIRDSASGSKVSIHRHQRFMMLGLNCLRLMTKKELAIFYLSSIPRSSSTTRSAPSSNPWPRTSTATGSPSSTSPTRGAGPTAVRAGRWYGMRSWGERYRKDGKYIAYWIICKSTKTLSTQAGTTLLAT